MAEYSKTQQKQLSKIIVKNKFHSKQLKSVEDNRKTIDLKNIVQRFTAEHLYRYPPKAQEFQRSNPRGGNIAYFIDNPVDSYRGNGSAHSEEKLLDELHSTTIAGTTDSVSTIGAKVAKLSGKTPKKKDIFTVQYPCNGRNYGADFNCGRLLNLGLTSDSIVKYVYNTNGKNEPQ